MLLIYYIQFLFSWLTQTDLFQFRQCHIKVNFLELMQQDFLQHCLTITNSIKVQNESYATRMLS